FHDHGNPGLGSPDQVVYFSVQIHLSLQIPGVAACMTDWQNDRLTWSSIVSAIAPASDAKKL
ncbi:hypothetical protein, partial [Pseudomonas protegens]|uniref:hypothetical protein n=1 Tax=Pseudomonas protegens TaxID=380021 RepID=UPI00223B4F70